MKIFLVTLAPILLLSLLPHSLSQRCNKNDEKVLFQIRKSLGDPYHLASWQKGFDCCEWYCVECHPKTNRINALTIFSGNISGQIPDAVGDLPHLETLLFRKLTNLTGSIPIAITKLTRLTRLTLSWTNLTGPVPSFLSRLKTLIDLDLSFNDLTGSIPPELLTLPSLRTLHLDRNKLTGPIPGSYGASLWNVPYVYLSHNQLSGPVPAALAYVNFTWLDVSRNKLEGGLSVFFGANKTIERADFSRNTFEFDFGEVGVFPAGLSGLDLNHNRIFGRLPAALTGLDLQTWNVSYNRLCGEIPQGGNLQKYDETAYFHNRCLCGSPLPSC